MDNLFANIKVETVALVVLLLGFLTTFILIPKLIGISRYKNLMDHPDERSSHDEKTPTLGGVAFYISLIFGLFTIHFFDFNGSSFNVLVGISILFFVGLKDDLMVLSAQTKLGAEIIAASFVLAMPDLWLTNFNGFLGIGHIPVFVGILLSYFIIIFVINAYNLIDGIDGLAGSLGIKAFVIFATFFYFSNNFFYFLLSILSIGFLIAFLRFNLSKKNKIFMGDTGSLIIGFLIAIMIIRFIAMSVSELDLIRINPTNKFIIATSILFFPFMDVFRVVIMRLLNRRGPFDPDRSHMHHILVDKSLKHTKASLTMSICSFIIFCIIYFLNAKLSALGLSLVFLFLTMITFSVLIVLDSDKHASLYRKKFKAIFPRPIQVIEFRIRKRIIIVMKKIFYKDLL
ncbi:MraY family glycosyltransferase [Lutimonas vermicola]|uniref:MraY family glycosyltransferase n=1 Tax=Lutimonas vermicola TaxID=414288 RepID=A0ABU9L430_9FLAO